MVVAVVVVVVVVVRRRSGDSLGRVVVPGLQRLLARASSRRSRGSLTKMLLD